MKFASKIELIAGIGTMVLALVLSGFYILATSSLVVLQGSFIYVGLPMLIAIGSYFHVIRGRIAGLVILLLSGLIFIAVGLLGGVIGYARGSSFMPGILAYVTAAAAVIAAVFATRR